MPTVGFDVLLLLPEGDPDLFGLPLGADTVDANAPFRFTLNRELVQSK